MKLNLRNETLSIQTILQISYFSSSFIFIPQTNLDFPKKITLHARKTFLFFYKILSRFPSSFLSLRSFLFQPSSWLSPLIPFSLFHLHTHTHTHILQFTLLNVQENVSSACNLQSCYPGWIFTSARRHAGRIGRGANQKTRSSVLTSIFWNNVIDTRFCHAFFFPPLFF